MDQQTAIDFIYQIIYQVVGVQGDIVATYAADLYDYIARAEGRRNLESATIQEGATDQQLRNDAAYAVHMLMTGEEIEQWITDRVESHIRHAGNRTMEVAAIRDGRKYARIPTSAHPCAFCITMASRGFVYGSRQKAGEGNEYHPHCTCKVIASDSGDVEGYDPQKYLDMYQGGYERAKNDDAAGGTSSHNALNGLRRNLRDDPEYKAHENELRRAWYEKNKDRINAQRRERRREKT